MSDHYIVEFAPEYQGMLERIAAALEAQNEILKQNQKRIQEMTTILKPIFENYVRNLQ